MVISATLDDFEADALAGLLRREIVNSRQLARVEAACGEMTAEVLAQSESYANWLESMAKKLFPGFHVDP